MLCNYGFLSICTWTCLLIMAVFIKVILFIYVLYAMFTTIQSCLISKQDLNIDFCFISTCLIFDKKPVIVGIMHAITVRVSEWLKLTPNEKYSVIPRRNKLHSMIWWWCPLYTRQARLNWILIVLAHLIIVDGHSFHDQWSNGWRDLIECGRSWARAPVGSNIRLYNWEWMLFL
jgi:hypothetical protein